MVLKLKDLYIKHTQLASLMKHIEVIRYKGLYIAEMVFGSGYPVLKACIVQLPV